MSNQSMQSAVKAFVLGALSEVNIYRDDESARIKAIRDGLGLITDKFGVEEYSFNLAMDVFVEAAYKNLSECLKRILDESDFDSPDDRERNIIFAAYYALSLIRKKQDDVDGLCQLIGEEYDDLRDFALHFEVHSRYYKRVGKYREALSCDKRAINVLKRNDIINVALCISYASTLCTMLKNKDTSLRDEDVELAKNYIEAAIEFNPVYPKYYFLKAQLVFLSAVRKTDDLKELEAASREAIELIDERADVYLYEFYRGKNVFENKERAKYEDFKEFMQDILDRRKNPRFPKTDAELDELKAKIFASESQDKCTSVPPLPILREGDKYLFVCYSSRDFKAVYSDLIELYKRKVPFKYDGHLPGLDAWQIQVENGIDSPDCAGVVFYISQNVLLTESVCEEIDIAEKHGKMHQCVNLEGSKPPSHILSDLLVKRHAENPSGYYISAKNMRLFLNYFRDNIPFTHRFDDSSHLNNLIVDLMKVFPQIIIGD